MTPPAPLPPLSSMVGATPALLVWTAWPGPPVPEGREAAEVPGEEDAISFLPLAGTSGSSSSSSTARADPVPCPFAPPPSPRPLISHGLANQMFTLQSEAAPPTPEPTSLTASNADGQEEAPSSGRPTRTAGIRRIIARSSHETFRAALRAVRVLTTWVSHGLAKPKSTQAGRTNFGRRRRADGDLHQLVAVKLRRCSLAGRPAPLLDTIIDRRNGGVRLLPRASHGLANKIHTRRHGHTPGSVKWRRPRRP